MPNPSGIRAGQAFVELFADDSRLVRGLKNASRRLKAWGRSVTAIGRRVMLAGTAALGGAFAAAKTFARMGDVVQKMAKRTGLSAEALSELSFAAEQSGTDLASLENGLRRMQRTIGDALQGLSTAEDALAMLGLSVQQLLGLAPEEQFKLIADRIARIEDPTLKAAAAMEVFGRSGTMLLPLMERGAAGIEALQKQARELGLTISTEDANAAAELTDALNILWRVIKAGAFAIGAALAGSLKRFVDRAAETIKHVADWVRNNRQLVATVLKVAAAVTAAGISIMLLGFVLSALGTVFGMLAAAIAGVGTVLKLAVTLFGALLSPIGLVAGALVALAGYLAYVSGTGTQALSWLGRQFAALRDEATAAWQGIANALAAGDIGLAARILWLTLKMEWQKGVAWLTEKWVGFKETFMAVATEAVYGTAGILTKGWALLQSAWVETVAFMSRAWTKFTHHLVTGWRMAQNWIAKKFVQLMAMFDSSVDAEAAMRILDEDFEREQQARDRRTQQELADIEATRQEKQQQIEEQKQGALDVLDEERRRRHAERKRKYDAQIRKAEAELAEAKRQWKEALDQAAEQKGGEQSPPGDKQPPPPQFDTAAIGRAVRVVGTFSAMAVGGLGTGSPLERTARASEETAKNTKRLVRHAERNQQTFA